MLGLLSPGVIVTLLATLVLKLPWWAGVIAFVVIEALIFRAINVYDARRQKAWVVRQRYLEQGQQRDPSD